MMLGEVDRFLVPEDDRDAVDYFLRRLFVAHGLGERMRWRVLRERGGRLAGPLLFRARWRLDPEELTLRPVEGDSTRPARRLWRSADPLLRAAVGEGAGIGGRLPVDRAILLRDYGGSPRGQLLLFPFRPDAAVPTAVVKVAAGADGTGGASARGGSSLRAEGDALRSLREELPPALRSSLPRRLAFRSSGETECLVLSHVTGRPAYGEMQNHLLPRRRVEAHFRAAADWLAAFHEATVRPGTAFLAGPEDRRRARRLAEPAGGEGVPEWYEDLLCRLDRRPLPLSAVHGDFWARNLLVPGEGTRGAGDPPARVVDWEHAEPEAPPFRDLFDFPVSYGLNYPWRRYRRLRRDRAFRRTFLERNAVSAAVRRYVRRYGRSRGLSLGLLDRLFRLYVTRRAAEATGERHRRWVACWRALPDSSRHLFGR